MKYLRWFSSKTASAFALGIVLWWLAVVELGVRTMPLPKLAHLLGVPLSVETSAGGDADGRAPAPLVSGSFRRRQLRVLAKVVPHWPFCDGACLREALVAGRILRRQGPALRLGAATADGDLVAHAWVELDGGVVGRTGGFMPLTRSGDTS
jgi:hypothetical protein